jgi:hypothetical protein
MPRVGATFHSFGFMQHTRQNGGCRGVPVRENIMRSKAILAGVAVLIALMGPALADHGKVGLWQITTKMTMPGMAQHSSQTFTSQHCMTSDEVKQNAMPSSSNADCKMVNQKMNGNAFSGDMVCTGRAIGSGHIAVTYDTNSHYAGQMTMTSTAGGQTMHMSNTFEGKWISADCGKAPH